MNGFDWTFVVKQTFVLRLKFSAKSATTPTCRTLCAISAETIIHQGLRKFIVRVWQQFANFFFAGQFCLEKFLVAVSFDKKSILMNTNKEEFLWQQTDDIGSYQARLLFSLHKKKVFIFGERETFGRETFPCLRNYFSAQRETKETFSYFHFLFSQTTDSFLRWTNIFNSEKNDESFFTLFIAFFGRTKRFFYKF